MLPDNKSPLLDGWNNKDFEFNKDLNHTKTITRNLQTFPKSNFSSFTENGNNLGGDDYRRNNSVVSHLENIFQRSNNEIKI